MADRIKGENPKPVKNPLLSGAGVGFPFENFPGSSLLVPVSRESPAVLLEDVEELDTFVGQEAPASQGVKSEENNQTADSQKYTGLFSSFFGSSQAKEDLPPQSRPETKSLDTHSSVSSSPRSYSPFVHVPSVTSYSPALFVPEDKPANLVTVAAVQRLPTLVPSSIAESDSYAPPAVTLVPQSSPQQTLTAQPPTLYFSNPPSSGITSESFPPPPPKSQSNPTQGNLYRQVAKEPKNPHSQPPVHHFMPLDTVLLSSQDTTRPATSDLPTSGTIPVETADSTSSSNDSIVADLQSRFHATDIGSNINSDNSVALLSPEDEVQPSASQYEDPSSFFPSKFEELTSGQFRGSSQALFDSATHQHSSQPENRSTFQESFGAIGQPRSRPIAVTELISQKQSSYGVPFQGFGQLPSSESTTNYQEETKFEALTTEKISDEQLIKTVDPSNSDRTDSKKEEVSTGKFFYGQIASTEYTDKPPLSDNRYFDQPNLITQKSDSLGTVQGFFGQDTEPKNSSTSDFFPSALQQNVAKFDSDLTQNLHFNQQSNINSLSDWPSDGNQTSFHNPVGQIHQTTHPSSFPLEVNAAQSSTILASNTYTGLNQPSTAIPPCSIYPGQVVAPPSVASQPGYSTPILAQQIPLGVTPPSQGIPPVISGTAKYRLGSQRRPVYAPVPGLSSALPQESVSSQPTFPSTSPATFFTPTPIPQNPPVPFFENPTLTPPTLFSPVVTQSDISAPPSSFKPDSSLSLSSTLTNSFPASLTAYHPPTSSIFSPIPTYQQQPTAATSNSASLLNPVPSPNQLFEPSSSNPLFNPTPLPPVAMASPSSDSATLKTVDLTTPSPSRRSPSPSVVPQKLLNLGQSGVIYRPPYHHWFWNNDNDDKESWQPFSMNDSLELEQAFNSSNLTMDTMVATDGGRYDVAVVARRRESVYWTERPRDVRRCSWFYRTMETRFRPYDENTAYLLEEEFKMCVTSATWNRRVILNDGDCVVLYGPSSMAHFIAAQPGPDGWEATENMTNQTQNRPRVVKRGVEDFEIEDGESPVVDHLLFVVHGIGSVCDLKFRKIEEAVNDFRSAAYQLVKTHYRTSVEQGEVNRIEILPVSWHHNLHDESGVDEKLKKITLKSIPKLRHFTNDTLLDILFYTSPVYCDNIMQQVGQCANRLYDLFLKRNPSFTGNVSVAGHSLGSLILFDMLCHQKRPRAPDEEISSTQPTLGSEKAERDRTITRTASYVTGTAGTGQPFITYPQLKFQPSSFFAMGSPIGMFVTVRGIDSLGLEFRLPTCPGFFNIFHPFDPVAYRIEALINPELADTRPVLIPHHKGRKRMHLELRETMARVGADIKQRVIDSVKMTWNTVYQLTMFGRSDEMIQHEVDRAIASQLEARTRSESSCEEDGSGATVLNAGVINQGRRIDYVLQEAPLESFNEYVSAITSHVCYWDSEDTILFILKDIYNNMGISAESAASIAAATEEQAPPSPPSPSGFVHQPHSGAASNPAPLGPMGMDPTAPMSSTSPIQPPPMMGFVRK